MLKPFTGIKALTLDALRIQLQSFLTDLFAVAISQGNIVTVKFPASANTDLRVEHGLSRTPMGYLVVQRDAAGTVYSSPTVPKEAEREIYLRSNTSSLSAKLWIF